MATSRSWLCALATALAAPAHVHTALAQGPARDSAAIEALVRPYVSGNNFSGQVLVAHGPRIVFARAYGSADQAHGVANTLDTRLHVASVSMQFTAAAIMRLVDLGKLTLDTRVSAIVPSVRRGDRITIRNLLEERSGLSDINQRADYAQILTQHQTPASLVAMIAGDTLLFPPGSRHVREEHSAYNLLALVVEKTTGLDFPVALRQLVFDPLHMTGAGADDDSELPAGPPRSAMARGYEPEGVFGLKAASPIHWSAKAGNASVYLTARDELRWIRALFNGHFLSVASRAAIVDPAGPPVGYGWFRRRDAQLGEFAYHMTGRSPGFSSFVLHLPGSDVTVIVLSNIYSSVTSAIGSDIAALLLRKPYAPFVAGNALTSSELRALDGLAFRFAADFYQPDAALVLAARGTELYLQWPGGSLTPLIPVSRDRFVDRAYWEPVVIQRDTAGRVVSMMYDRFPGRRE